VTAPSVSAAGGVPSDAREAAVRKAAGDLQGLFIQQLYKTMRESVPDSGGLVEKSQGEEVFAGLMDEHLAADTGSRWHRGLGDAIYRALAQKAGLDGTARPAGPTPVMSMSGENTARPLAAPARLP
jgi:peptidoglycan hydrolase FlgJ